MILASAMCSLAHGEIWLIFPREKFRDVKFYAKGIKTNVTSDTNLSLPASGEANRISVGADSGFLMVHTLFSHIRLWYTKWLDTTHYPLPSHNKLFPYPDQPSRTQICSFCCLFFLPA